MNIKIFYLRAYFTYEVYSATSLEVANFGGFLSLFNSSNRSSVNAFTTTTKVKKKNTKNLKFMVNFSERSGFEMKMLQSKSQMTTEINTHKKTQCARKVIRVIASLSLRVTYG